jgi:hypothetical protein
MRIEAARQAVEDPPVTPLAACKLAVVRCGSI